MNDVKELIDKVISNDYCIGCGVCASVSESPFTMILDENGKYRPVLKENYDINEIGTSVLSVCPFSENNNIETDMGEENFGDVANVKFNKYSGYYIKSYAGYVKEGDYRANGSSGGMGSWIAAQLLEQNLVDGIIHVKSNTGDDSILFDYQISKTVDELLTGSKSKYYPIEMSKVLQFVRENNGRYALIGIPCFIKAARLLAKEDTIVKERLKYFIGLVCGHLKSDFFAKSIGWELGIEPEELTGIDFRKKIKGRKASNYGIEVTSVSKDVEINRTSPTIDLYTTNWGHGLFKYNACEFCDDVLAETADITVGDAWLPEYTHDSQGTNIIIIRNPVIHKIFEQKKDTHIHIEELSEKKVYQSQAGGFRHRRDGLSYRLYLKDTENSWRPNKRVQPSNKHTLKRKKIYNARGHLIRESFKAYKEAKEKSDFNYFIDLMDPHLNAYNKLNKSPFLIRAFRKIKREIQMVNKKIE